MRERAKLASASELGTVYFHVVYFCMDMLLGLSLPLFILL